VEGAIFFLMSQEPEVNETTLTPYAFDGKSWNRLVTQYVVEEVYVETNDVGS